MSATRVGATWVIVAATGGDASGGALAGISWTSLGDGVAETEAEAGLATPAAFTATTEKVCSTSFVKPLIVHECCVSTAINTAAHSPSGELVTVNDDTATAVASPGTQLMVTDEFPGSAVTEIGAEGMSIAGSESPATISKRFGDSAPMLERTSRVESLISSSMICAGLQVGQAVNEMAAAPAA